MKIGAIVILYNPDNNLKARLLSYLPYVEKLYVFDNTENKDNSSLIDTLPSGKVTYYADNENKGISIRLNQAIMLSKENNLTWLLTMDQDSYFEKVEIENYLQCFNQYEQKNQVAMFGVNFHKKSNDAHTCSAERVRHLITSGSLLNLELINHIGLFDEALFIDKVDHEYCIRASLLGYHIIQFNNVFLNHELGTIVYGRSIKNLKITPRTIHAPIRIYYILRNYFYLKNKYENATQDSINEMKKENWIRIKNNFLYGKKRLLLLKYISKAYLDYKNGKMGKIE